MKKILYIGNNLGHKSSYATSMDFLSKQLRQQGYTVVQCSDKSNQLLRLLDMVRVTLTHIKKVDYVLIDTFSTLNFYYALIISQLCRVFKLKYIPILHGGNLPKRLEKNRYLSNLIFEYSYKLVTPSKYLEYVFKENYDNVVFIPNGIDLSLYEFKKRKQLKPKLFWLRAFHKTYNPIMALKVLKELKKSIPEVELCMVGPVKDESFKECEKYIKENNLTQNIKITGVLNKEEWIALSRDYDIFINTTNYDNVPVSVVEIMALGLPIVSTNVGGMPYLLSDKETGLLVPRNDENAMSDAIKFYLDNNDIAYSFTKRAKRMSQDFDGNLAIERWKEIVN